MDIKVLITRLKEEGNKIVNYESEIRKYHSFVIQKIKDLTGKEAFLIDELGLKYFRVDNKKYKYMDIVGFVEEWKRRAETLEEKTSQMLQQFNAKVEFIPESSEIEVKKQGNLLFKIDLKSKEIKGLICNLESIAITQLFPKIMTLIQRF